MDRFNECLSDAITAYRLTAYSDENMPLNDENIYESGFEAGWNAFNESKQSVIENIKLSWNGGLVDIAKNFNDSEVRRFVEDNIDKLSDEALINEFKERGLKV